MRSGAVSLNVVRRAALAAAILTVAAVAPALSHPHVFVANEAKAVFENGALSGLRYRWLFDEMYTTSAVEGLDTNKDGKLDASELSELLKVNIEGLKEFDYFTTATMAGKPVPFADAKDFTLDLVEVAEAPGPQLVADPASASAERSPAASAPVQQASPQRPGMWARISGWFSGLFGRAPAATATTTVAQTGSDARPAPPQAPGLQQARAPAPKAKVLELKFTLPFKNPVAANMLTGDSTGFQFQVHDPQMFIWFEPAGPDAIGLASGAPAGCRHAMVEPQLDEEQKKLAEAFSRVGAVVPGGQGKAVAVICAAP